MNKGFMKGFPFIVKEGNIIAEHILECDSVVKITLDSGAVFTCGKDQELFSNDQWIKAEESLECELSNGSKVVEIEHLTGSFELQDITVDNNEHSFYIQVGEEEIKVHNLSIGSYLSVRLPSVKYVSVPTTSNTNSGTQQETVNDTNVYIPAQDIQFTGSLFKPNTRLYVFFDGRDVSSYVQPTSGTTGTPLVTDQFGYCTGTFHLPNTTAMKFVAGKKELKFTDSSTNDNNQTTWAITYFTYTGSNDNTEDMNTGGTTNNNNDGEPTIQSFTVLDKGGIYLTKLNLYFQQKDTYYPILLQIREVSNGVVSAGYLTDSNIVIQPSSINVSTSGTLATTVSFPAPVYLQEGKEYCIYLLTNAPASYIIATCEYGMTNTSNQIATKDPRTGAFMKKLSATSWMKDTSRGIKFDLIKCKFDTSQTYYLNLENVATPTKNLNDNSIGTNNGTNVITITDTGHSFNVGSFVTVSGLADGNYAGISANYINGVHRITAVTWNTYSFNNVIQNNSEISIPTNASSSIVFGTNITTDQDYQYDNIVFANEQIQLSDTVLDYQWKGLSGQSLDGVEVPYQLDTNTQGATNKTEIAVAKVKKISSPYNEQYKNPGLAKSLQLKIGFRTSNPNISPVVDKFNTNVILVENLINNQSYDELTTDNGLGVARCIFKDLNLQEPSQGVRVTFNANIQSNASVKVYYKTLGIDESGNINDKPWVQMTLDRDVQSATNSDIFNDYVYTVDSLPFFKTVKTKVLMNSTDSTKAPVLRKYRTIAFQ